MDIKPLKILGIDPGTNVTGYGLIEIRNKKPVIIDKGKITPKRGLVHYERLKVLHEEALKLMVNFKQSMTGMGRASKEQVAYFLQKVYHLDELPEQLDISDAIAVAICHFIQLDKPKKSKEYKNWGDFIKKNPGRVK